METRNPARRSAAALALVALALFSLRSLTFAQAAKKEKVDLLVAGGMVVTMDGERRILQDGTVAVKGDAILAEGRCDAGCVAEKIYFSRGSKKRDGRFCALGNAAGSGRADPGWRDDLRGHVLFRGCDRGRDQG